MSQNEPSVFTRIIQGDLPCYKVYEDKYVFAFLDINPVSRGHLLIVPKEQVATLDQLSDDSSAAIGRVLPRLARVVLAATKTVDFNLLQNNGAQAYQSVFHVHFHIIPKHPDGSGLSLPFQSKPLDADEGSKLAATMRTMLSD